MREELKEILRDQGRGVVGALLLGTPLLFTMETWWLGWTLPIWTLLLFALGGLALIMALVRVGGFRKNGRPRGIVQWGRQFSELVLQSAFAAFAVLFLFGVLSPKDPWETLARVGLLEMVPLGLGAALANTILKGSETERPERERFPKDVAIFGLGALFFTLPIAPTDEMPLMAAHAGWWHLAGVVVASLLVTYLALYELGFRGQRGRTWPGRELLHAGQACLVYATGLSVAVLLMAGYGQFQGEPVEVWLQKAIVLGFPAAMGGAAAQVAL